MTHSFATHLRSVSIKALLFFWALNAYGSNLQGTITDPLGAVIANAQVQLIAHGQAIASGSTDSKGSYHLETAQSGRMHLHIEAPTFAAADTPSFYVNGRTETITQDAFLALKNVAQEIVVTATGVPTSEAQVGVPVDVLKPADYLNRLDILDSLPSLAGLEITQTGQRGGTTSLFMRGGNSNANKVLLDGVPLNDIGGEVEFGDLSINALDKIEVSRGPNSVLYGSDALAGVISVSTRHGTTPLPQLEYSIDGGNFRTLRHEAALSGTWRRLDYFSDLARFDTANDTPNNEFHNETYAGAFGWSLARSGIRVTIRRIATAAGLPNAIDLFGLPDNAQQRNHDTIVSATYELQATPRWHSLVRYGASRLISRFEKPSATGILNDGSEFGLPVTIRGANGFTVNGQAFLSTADCCPSLSLSNASRDFVYAQTDYRVNTHATFLLGYRYEAERGASVSSSLGFTFQDSVDRRNMSFILETHGDLRNRLFYSVGGAVEKNEIFGVEAVPRLSLAYYPIQSGSGLFRATKLNFNFGKGIKEPSIFDESSSLFALLSQQPGGNDLIQKFGIRPMGAERSRSYDFGVEQWLADRVRVGVMLFHNQFTNEIEFVSSNALPALGIPPEIAAASGFGATINSADFRAEGVETQVQYRMSGSMMARGGYTYLDALVQHSFSSDALSPAINPLFPNIPIGAFSPLVGARPFRRAPHAGFLSLSYNHSRLAALLQGTFVSRRDDSTFLLFSDINFGNTLLLPNRNLDSAYQKLDLSASFRLTSYLTSYVSMENLLNQRYDAAFGFPSLPFTVRSGLKITLGGESWHRR